MLRKKIQVTISGGIHMAVAAALGRMARETDTHIFLKSGKKMVSAREMQKLLALGVRQTDQVEVIADGEEEAAVMDRMEKILCGR